ncbi:MAG: pantoate--beta-alanine ligase [Acidimicrobiia bacterium]|nr:pantoate--beta-alanine ligase [Acidimicrobiia bacterium]MCC5954364.1 pantoate--beta-alanine ligase [Acidimicrobiia bacterium]
MQVIQTISELRGVLDATRARGGTVGLVPTMGYLHDGHLSLVGRAVEECDVVTATIFVNPLQFAAGEDLDAYPRDLERDRALAERAGCDVLFTPSQTEMYPEPMRTEVTVASLSAHMEGAARPTHFAGVATVVAKLFAIAGPCRAYFGEKDFQQLAVVRRMASDLSFPVAVVGCPTVREADGLAMSSRNVYLTDDERAVAPVLHRALTAAAAAVEAGERSGAAVRAQMTATVAAEQRADLDYAEVVDAATLEPLDELRPGATVRLLVAARLGRPRLLDNVGVTVPE